MNRGGNAPPRWPTSRKSAAALLAADVGDQAGQRAAEPENDGTEQYGGEVPKDEAGQDATDAAHEHAWALVAARLGNKANRTRFVGAAWYHTPEEPDGDQDWLGLRAVLKRYEEEGPEQPWSAATAEFRAVEAREAAVRAERSAVHDAVEQRVRLANKLADLRRAAPEATERLLKARERHALAALTERERQAEADRVAAARRIEAERLALEQRTRAEQVVRSWEAELDRRWQAHEAHRRSRPGLWQRLTMPGVTGRGWAEHDQWLADQVRLARQELDAAHRIEVSQPVVTQFSHEPLVEALRELVDAEREVDAAVRDQTKHERAVRGCEADLAAIDARLTDVAAALGRHYPDAAWWQDRERRDLTALWIDSEWNKARSELFLAALRLHKAFLQQAPTELRRNLQAAMDLVSGEAPGDLPEDAALAAWQSLFFVVPVVSTTFASYARLFRHLGKESLGWLLIDEAGQATPQNAVGALWRTKRAVVVGDPLQLEPITTLPFRAEQAIRNELDVDEQWSTSRSSVQRLADRPTRLGTWLPGEEGKTWVGVPLTVHRRCDQPMFGIVNSIAYDGLMIDGTGRDAGERFAARYPKLPPSKWIDVVSSGSRGHWIPEEGLQLDRILSVLAGFDFDMSEVMVIGPFRDVARQVSTRSRRYPGLVAGTVHTAQGKQADVVILVLGGAPDRPGARRWAASKPNLLNVAVSRAKRRLYVIGNRAAWSSQPYFSVLAANLPHSAPIHP
jgi:AAA domain